MRISDWSSDVCSSDLVYDRSELINAAIETLKGTLIEESIVVALVTVAFLLHVRSALVAIIMLPIGILIAFTAMRALGIGANIKIGRASCRARVCQYV